MDTRKFLLPLLVLTLIALAGCKSKEVLDTTRYDRQLGPGELALRKITNPEEIPDFTAACQDLDQLRKAVANSLNYMGKPSSKLCYPYGEITHEQAVASLQAFAKLLDSGVSGAALNDAIHQQFDTWVSVGCDDQGTVLFTGYYTPIFNGSQQPTDKFKYPLYSMPADLVKDEKGDIKGRKMSDGSIVPYPKRDEIEQSGMLKGLELVWLGDPFEVYVAHVQGSAKIRKPDGNLMTVGYAANNGYDYRPIGQELIKDKKIPAGQMSLDAMIKFFREHPDEVQNYINRNPRFVFFRENPDQPHGSLNEPVIAWRSIATDKSIYPRAGLAFLDTRLPRMEDLNLKVAPYKGFALDQDTGGAIRAPGRCDIYMGQGRLAGKLAGQTFQEGKLYYIFLKSTAPQPAPTLAPAPAEPPADVQPPARGNKSK
jgi:membrane-bound lytic murein transglycosylase A